jgi:hypothetical protein
LTREPIARLNRQFRGIEQNLHKNENLYSITLHIEAQTTRRPTLRMGHVMDVLLAGMNRRFRRATSPPSGMKQSFHPAFASRSSKYRHHLLHIRELWVGTAKVWDEAHHIASGHPF